MLDPESILRLYANVLHNDIVVNSVPTNEIRKSVQCMAHVYAPDPDNAHFGKNVLKFLNFNDTACRCAYLHKFAPLHTYIVFDAMLKIFQRELAIFRNLVTDNRTFHLCSLGGGPGSDVVGALLALRVVFDTVRASVSIVDCMGEWESTFESVVKEMKFGGYGPDWFRFADDLKWDYLGANLLCAMSPAVNTAIGSASLITMMKFISAAACTDTEEMVDKIFRVMKIGALVLYIDNAAGGFTQLIERSGRKNGLIPVFGPLRHVQYNAEALKIDRFGYTSCYQTKVTIILLQKVLRPNLNREIRPDPKSLQGNTEPRKKLDFIVYENRWDNSNAPSTPLNVSFFSPKPNPSGIDSKCVEKYPEKLNNIKVPSVTSNTAGTFQNFAGTSASNSTIPQKSNFMSPEKSNMSPKKSNSTSPQKPNSTSPRKPNRVTPRRPQPVTRTPAAAQRYQPVPSAGNNVQPQVDYSDDAGCSCCVIS